MSLPEPSPSYMSFASYFDAQSLPSWLSMPEKAMPKEVAYHNIHDELQLEGDPKLITESLNQNFVDMNEYAINTELHNRCVNLLARMFNAPMEEGECGVGVGTIGSSEAIMLAGLAFKKRWQHMRKAQGKPFDKPNIVTGSNVHVCWEKFARYSEVELKQVKVREGNYVMDPERAVEMVDENTIGVTVSLGSTYNGEFEDVELLNDLLLEKNKETGWETPIHVDAASGGLIAPLLYAELKWDFRLRLVKSINVSGHKYGLVYAGIGWVLWGTKQDLPQDLVNYLQPDQSAFSLKFSKGSSQLMTQYHQLIRLRKEGHRNVMEKCKENAMVVKKGIVNTGCFNILSKDDGLPVVAFSLKDDRSYKHDEFEISAMLRHQGWMVPAYLMPPGADHITALRIVIRDDFSRTVAERLVLNITNVLLQLQMLPQHIMNDQNNKKRQNV